MLDKSLGEKIKNYFSDRIEEIKDGTYIPQYERFVSLPEFSGINRRTFKIARNEWYLQHFSKPFVKFTARLEKIKEIMDKEIEYKKQIKGKRNNGLCFLIPGAIIFIWALSFGISANWPGSMAAIVWIFGIPFGIILMVIGFGLVLSDKFRKYYKGLFFLIPALFYIVVGLIWVGIIFLLLSIGLVLYNSIKMSEKVSYIISDIPELEAPLELSLRDNVGALLASPNKAKDFYISVRNRNPNLTPDIKVQLSVPPKLK